MIGLLFLARSAMSACTTNALRDIYKSASFKIQTATGAGYDFLADSSTRVSRFASGAPAADNWCTNQTAVLGTVSDFCCTTAQATTIGKQFMTKHTYGFALLALTQIGSGMSSSSAAKDFTTACKFKTSYDTTKLASIATDANRSIWGLYYAVGKIATAVLPFVQAETCLICADDATIANYYSAGNLKVNKASFNSMISALGSAANDYNTAFSGLLQVYADIYLKYVIDLDASSSNCTDIIKSLLTSTKWCTSVDNCTKVITPFFANTVLEFEAMADALSEGRRLLSSRLLATTAVETGGAGFSTYSGFTSNVKINGATLSQLKAAYGSLMTVLMAVLMATLLI